MASILLPTEGQFDPHGGGSVRYSLLKLLALTTAVAIYVAAVFALPWMLSLLVLGCITFAQPAMYAAGILYSRKYWKAFWIGCTACGIAPALIANWYVLTMLVEFSLDELFTQGDDEKRLLLVVIAVFQVAPVLGGLTAVAMRRIYKSSRSFLPPSCAVD